MICVATGKVIHAKYAHARKAGLKRHNEKPLPGKTLADVGVYKCKSCGAFHWGYKRRYRF